MVSSANVWDELNRVNNPVQPVALVESQPAIVVKRGKPKIPKNWNALVLKPVMKGEEIIGTECWFEYVEKPEGRIRTYVEDSFFWPSKKKVYSMIQNENGDYEAFTPPEYLEVLPEQLHRASKGCDAYSKFLAYRNTLMEKLKVALMFGIMGLLVFVIFMMLSDK